MKDQTMKQLNDILLRMCHQDDRTTFLKNEGLCEFASEMADDSRLNGCTVCALAEQKNERLQRHMEEYGNQRSSDTCDEEPM